MIKTINFFIDIVHGVRIMGTGEYEREFNMKTRLNISTDQDLADFIKVFAAENRTTVAEIFTQYVLTLKRNVESAKTEQILSNPVFHQSMKESQAKLQSGAAVWHSYDDVFGD